MITPLIAFIHYACPIFDSTHYTNNQTFLSRNPTNTNPNLINQGFEGLNVTNCGLGLEIAQGPITNPNPWMRRSQNLKEMLEIEEEKGNSINECGHDELDHTNELGQPKFTQFGQIN